MTGCLYRIAGFKCAEGCALESCTRSKNLDMNIDKAGLGHVPREKLLALRDMKYAKTDEVAVNTLFDIQENLKPWVVAGKSLYICSKNCGNGKTSWSLRLLMNWLMVASHKRLLEPSVTTPIGMFVRPHALMNEIKASFTYHDPELPQRLANIRNTPLVVWDDLGCAKVSPYDQNILIDIIGIRELHGGANIYTSNLNTFDKLTDSVGERLTSRIWNASTVVELRGKDRRGSV